MVIMIDNKFYNEQEIRCLVQSQANELKELREENKVLMQECDRLIKEKGKLLKKSEQIAKYKSLLKEAVEDFDVYGALKDLPAAQRVQHPNWRRFNRILDVLDHRWRCADEALKLIESKE